METWFKVGVIASVVSALVCGASMLIALAVWYGWKPPIVKTVPMSNLTFLPIIVGAAGLCLLAFTWVALYLSFRAIQQSPSFSPTSVQSVPSASIPAPSTENRVFVDATPQELTSRFQGHTSFEADTLLKPFIGKWLKVSGPLKDISAFQGGAIVTIDQTTDDSHRVLFVQLIFDSNWLDRLSTIKPKTNIHVVGQIVQVNQWWVHLSKCELTD